MRAMYISICHPVDVISIANVVSFKFVIFCAIRLRRKFNFPLSFESIKLRNEFRLV